MRQSVQVVRQGEPTPYHFDFNSLINRMKSANQPIKAACTLISEVQAAFLALIQPNPISLWRGG